MRLRSTAWRLFGVAALVLATVLAGAEAARRLGSDARFRESGFWVVHRDAIAVTLGVLAVQTALIAGLLVNLRARRRAERSLRESEEQVRLAVTAAGAGLWSMDVRTQRLWGDRHMRALLDPASRRALSYPEVLAMLPPADRVCVDLSVQRTLQTGTPLSVELRVPLAEGAARWIAVRGHRIDGRPDRLTGIAVDVTERKAAEVRLRESEARLASAVVVAALGFYDLHGDERTPFFDEHLRLLLGLPDGLDDGGWEFWERHLHPDDRESVLALRDRMLRGEASHFSAEYRYLHPRHGRLWLRHSSQVLARQADGRLLHAVGVIQDTTVRRESQEKLRESEELGRTVLASLVEQVVILDRDANVLACNDASRHPEFVPSAMPGSNYLDLCRGVLPGDVLGGIESVLSGGSDHFAHEYRRVSADGPRWFLLRVMPLRRPGGGAVVAHAEVTERVRATEELRQVRSRLWHADRLSQASLITSSLAHELNQPLAAILSNAQAGLRFMAREDVDLDEIRAILADIVHDDKRAAGVITSLRGLLRRQEVPRETIDLENSIRGMLALLHGELTGEQIEVDEHLGAGNAVFADNAQIQQVVLNLVMNAIEAMRDRAPGQRRLEVWSARTGTDAVLVAMRDSGTGISEEQRAKMADAFWTTKSSGMGVGLHISRSIIESHGGRLWFENNEGQAGATFYFSLPLVPRD